MKRKWTGLQTKSGVQAEAEYHGVFVYFVCVCVCFSLLILIRENGEIR